MALISQVCDIPALGKTILTISRIQIQNSNQRLPIEIIFIGAWVSNIYMPSG